MKKATIFVSAYLVVVLSAAVIISLSGCEESGSESDSMNPFFSEEFLESQKAYEESFKEIAVCKGQGVFIPVNLDQDFKVTNPTIDENRILDIKVLHSWGGVLVSGLNEGKKYFSVTQEENNTRLKITVKTDCEIITGVIIINPGTSYQEVLHEQTYSQFLDISAQIEDSGLDESAVFLSTEDFYSIQTQEPQKD